MELDKQILIGGIEKLIDSICLIIPRIFLFCFAAVADNFVALIQMGNKKKKQTRNGGGKKRRKALSIRVVVRRR
jgi:hypothetical protein